MSSPITVVRQVARLPRLTVDVTMHEESGRLAVQLTRSKRDCAPRSFTLFEGELEDVIDALDDAADALLGPAESDQPESDEPASARAPESETK